MNHIKRFLQLFITITTGIVFIIAVDCTIHDYSTLPKDIMFQILGVAIATALVSAIVFSVNPKTKKGCLIQCLIHYILLCIIVCPSGIMFDWIEYKLSDVVVMCGYVAGVYALVAMISYIILANEANAFNKAINRRKNKKGE